MSFKKDVHVCIYVSLYTDIHMYIHLTKHHHCIIIYLDCVEILPILAGDNVIQKGCTYMYICICCIFTYIHTLLFN
jgi:hypothetical protein